MTNLRLWILILSGVSFVAGLALGLLLSEQLKEDPVEAGPFAAYEQMLIEEFDLNTDRAQHLRGILRHYQRDIERRKDKNMTAYMAAIEPELRELGTRYRGYIRDRVLLPDDRARFDGLCQALPAN